MTITTIPDEDHIVRTVGKQKWQQIETEEGPKIAVDNDLFLPREDYPAGSGPEEYVSIDWLEFFAGGLREQLDQVRDAVSARRKVGRQSQLAVVLVDSIHEAASLMSKAVRVATTGDEKDPSHSGIYGLEPSDTLIAQDIANASIPYPAYDDPS